MRRSRIHPRHSDPSHNEGPARIPPLAALTLCLILVASLLQACALVPIAVVASTTAAGLAMEAERAIIESDKSDVVVVDQNAVVYEGPGEQYSEVIRLSEGVEVKVLRQDGDWIECKFSLFEDGWIHVSAVKDI